MPPAGGQDGESRQARVYPGAAALEALPLDAITFAVTEAVHIGAIGFDAVKLIALARIERRPARLDLAAYPHLPKMDVKTTCAADYAGLAA